MRIADLPPADKTCLLEPHLPVHPRREDARSLAFGVAALIRQSLEWFKHPASVARPPTCFLTTLPEGHRTFAFIGIRFRLALGLGFALPDVWMACPLPARRMDDIGRRLRLAFARHGLSLSRK